MASYVIGAGGIGARVVELLARTVSPRSIIIIDADLVEARNLDRQLFGADSIGRAKAEIVAERHGCRARLDWFHAGLIRPRREDWIWCCADNHRARRDTLETCDRTGATCVIGGNATTDADAYLYMPHWRGTARDPRTYYPDLVTGEGGPLSACTGPVADQTPQLATANALAAVFMMHLFQHWTQQPAPPAETLSYRPIRHTASIHGLTTHKHGA